MERGHQRRKTPAKRVHISLSGPNWVFLTICTNQRERWLTNMSIMRSLHSIWERAATAWLVSDYLLMPDHLHLFCAPYDTRFSIEQWMGFWKDQLSKINDKAGQLQTGGFHHRLRHGESYSEKWIYVRMNPVRAGLVAKPEDWPYQGRVHDIRW